VQRTHRLKSRFLATAGPGAATLLNCMSGVNADRPSRLASASPAGASRGLSRRLRRVHDAEVKLCYAVLQPALCQAEEVQI